MYTYCPRPDKLKYATYESAEAQMYRMMSRLKPGKKQLNAYQCECGSFHVGRTELNVYTR